MCQLGLERDLRDLLRGGAADAIQYYIGRLVDGDNEETCFALAHVGGIRQKECVQQAMLSLLKHALESEANQEIVKIVRTI